MHGCFCRVGKGAQAPCPPLAAQLMPNYRRARINGGTYFFTLTLENRLSDLLVREIAHLRRAYSYVQQRRPFQTIAICVLPDHHHKIWSLPPGDCDFSSRWNLIKGSFSRGLPAASPTASKIRKREKGIWQRRYWEHVIRDSRPRATYRVHPSKSGQTRPRAASLRLAVQQFSSIRDAWRFADQLGWRYS